MRFLIAGNWKLNPVTLKKAKSLLQEIERGVRRVKKVDVLISPPFIYLTDLTSKGLKVKIGAQDCFWEKEGAFTGEISVDMLKNIGVKYVILGHSERRKYFKESNIWINKKIKAVLEKGLIPILCIGETLEDKRKGKTQKLIKFQLEKGLKGISKTDIKKVIIAYEPRWAIGTGKACKPAEAKVINIVIRKVIASLYTKHISKEINILYGGSVKKDNALGYLKEAQMTGLLIGGASLRPKEFAQIAKDASKIS